MAQTASGLSFSVSGTRNQANPDPSRQTQQEKTNEPTKLKDWKEKGCLRGCTTFSTLLSSYLEHVRKGLQRPKVEDALGHGDGAGGNSAPLRREELAQEDVGHRTEPGRVGKDKEGEGRCRKGAGQGSVEEG